MCTCTYTHIHHCHCPPSCLIIYWVVENEHAFCADILAIIRIPPNAWVYLTDYTFYTVLAQWSPDSSTSSRFLNVCLWDINPSQAHINAFPAHTCLARGKESVARHPDISCHFPTSSLDMLLWTVACTLTIPKHTYIQRKICQHSFWWQWIELFVFFLTYKSHISVIMI